MDPVTYEQRSVPRGLLGERAAWLVEGATLQLSLHGDDVLAGAAPALPLRLGPRPAARPRPDTARVVQASCRPRSRSRCGGAPAPAHPSVLQQARVQASVPQVVDASPPGDKGGSVSASYKRCTLSNGAQVRRRVVGRPEAAAVGSSHCGHARPHAVRRAGHGAAVHRGGAQHRRRHARRVVLAARRRRGLTAGPDLAGRVARRAAVHAEMHAAARAEMQAAAT
jgi:hypothetical protein